nr:hypothetical protein [Tanacetum cinerariifolium]
MNPTIYVSCIKQFWNTVAIKQSNDVTRLQALVDKKKVVVTEAAIRDALHLDDAEGVDCLPNDEIFTELARISYEKPSTKLTFYKAFFSSQCSEVETPLFKGMLVVRKPEEQDDAEEQGNDDNAVEEPVTAVLEDNRVDTSDDTFMEDVSNQGRIIDELDKNEGAVLMREKEEKETKEVKDITGDTQVEGRQADIYQIDMDHAAKVLKVVAAVCETVSAAAVVPTVTVVVVPSANVTPAPVKVVVPFTRRRRGVVIKDPEEESSIKTPTETKSKDKGKEAQARRNTMMYLKNTVGFRLDYFKGMSYDDIRLIFEAKFNSNIEFLLKNKEQIEEEENRVIASINETPAQKAAKRRRLNEEAEDVEELKQHLEIMPDKDDDVYTEATPLARKVPVVDYQIIQLNNKPHFKIIRADETHHLYVSFITLLKNFDREDL